MSKECNTTNKLLLMIRTREEIIETQSKQIDILQEIIRTQDELIEELKEELGI